MRRPRLSPYYEQLVGESRTFGVLNVPMGEQVSKVYMFAQTEQDHPII
jgi:hypothetical protein